MFKKFLKDKEALDMYVTGAAGTGKTTSMGDYVKHCIEHGIPYVVCAYTHKACDVLRSKLPGGAIVRTLHSLLKKVPSINTAATNYKHVNISIRIGEIDVRPKIIFIDEYSMIGEKDFVDLRDIQEEDLKIVWFGDPHQLPPVGDMPAVVPEGKYKLTLTKQYRNNNPLQQPLTKLISYIEKREEPAALEPVRDYFVRGLDLVQAYKDCDRDKVLLAYTNKKVQELNSSIAGKVYCEKGDDVFSPHTKEMYTFVRQLQSYEVTRVDRHWGDPLELGTKYKTLEHLLGSDLCDFGLFQDQDGEEYVFAYVFGHYNFKVAVESLTADAVECNKEIEEEFEGYKAADWCRLNYTHPLARKRARAWRSCLAFKDVVICMDFPYAMTVHKSQGSTYDCVFIDTDDLALCAYQNFEQYLKLMYVAISRASSYVGTC